jgi:uncharacterized protein (DUF1499 family)
MMRRSQHFRPFGWLFSALLLLTEPAMASLFGTLFAGTPPPAPGLDGGKLVPCPDRPNCVSSHAADSGHAIAPLAMHNDPAASMAELADAIRAMPGATVITARPDYIHAEFASTVFGFVDDVEFVPDAGANVIDVRSAARLGVSDFGVNRDRVEAIRSTFAARKP